MPSSLKLFGFLLLVILVSGCAGKAENTPISTLSFELSPPISEELVSAIGWTDSDMNSVYTNLSANTGVGGINRWSIAADSNGSFNTIILTEVNSSVLNKEWQIFRNLTNDTRDPINFSHPNIFYRESYFITQLCGNYTVSAYAGSRFFFKQILTGLEKYNCSPASAFTQISLEVPSFSIFNQQLVDYVKSEDYRLSSARFIGITGSEKAYFGFSSDTSSLEITQEKQDYKNYTYLLDLENKMATRAAIMKNESFRNGNYWLFGVSENNENGTMASKAMWYCNNAGLTITVRSQTETPQMAASYEEMGKMSKSIC